MSTSCYHTNYSNQKNNKNTGLPRSLRSLVMTGANSGLPHSFVMTGAEGFSYSPCFLKTKRQTFAMPGAEAQNKIVPNGFGTLFAQANNMGMQRYTITPTDTTVKEVARKLFGDDNYAYSIALANGVSLNDTLNTGKDIIIPPYIPTGIYSEPYLPPNAMFNYLSQGLQLDEYHFPKPKQKKKRHGFFKRLIVTVVAVVAAVVSMGTLAPALAGIFASMNLFAANVLATMAAAAVANVSTQATAMLLGVQKRFNWRSLAASVATAPIGMDHTFGASTSFSSIVGDIMISTTQNVLSQAIQGNVDINSIVLTAFTTAAGAQIPHHFQFPRIEMQNAFIAVTSTAFADMIENHGRINPENIAIAMAGVAAAYGANEINKSLEKYLPKKEMVEKQKPEKPVAKRLNPKAPLSQKELQDVKNAQSRLQKPSAKTPASRSRWQPASGNEMENDVGDIFSAMVNESFKNSDEPRGAPESRAVNNQRVEKQTSIPTTQKHSYNSIQEQVMYEKQAYRAGKLAFTSNKYARHFQNSNEQANYEMGYHDAMVEKQWLDTIDIAIAATGVPSLIKGTVAGAKFIGTRALSTIKNPMGALNSAWESTTTFFGKSGLNAMQGRLEISAGEILSTGGRQINSVGEWSKTEAQAKLFYDRVRSNPSNLDVKLISKNSGMMEFQVERIKQHLFFDIQELSVGRGQFAPDIEIADAWFRLQKGNFVKQDLNLLQHEYFESRFKGIFKTSYDVAHRAANDAKKVWKPESFITKKSMKWSP